MDRIGINNKRGFDQIRTTGSEYFSHKKSTYDGKENSINRAENSATELYETTIPTEVCPKSPELNNKSPNRKESKKSFKEFDSPAKGILCFESDGNQIITKFVDGEVKIFPLGKK